jgi:sphingomyelin phosphodiesterase 2
VQPPRSDRVTVATLNTLGIRVIGSRLPSRYKLIAEGLEKGGADVVCVQEIATYWHLRLLARRMPSFRHVSYQRAALGPAGALVTFSRLPVASVEYHPIGPPRGSAAIAGLPLRNRVTAGLRGALVTRLAGGAAGDPGLAVVNTHTTSNKDGDWTQANRHYPVHQAQLAGIAGVLRDIGGPAVACGDFNIPRQAGLLTGFLRDSRLTDAFGGTCPPTFRAEYLPAGATAYPVDFILTTAGVTAQSPALLFADRHPALPAPGYLSDHVGLTAVLVVAEPAAAGPPGAPAGKS